MHEILARNVHEALPMGTAFLREFGKQRDSRNGPTIEAPGPVTTTYERPWECVILHPERDANPFFHLMEALWMLAGRRDLAFLLPFSKQIAEYSDDGVSLQGSYGFRWRQHFGFDQLRWVIDELKANPDTRRAMVMMFDPVVDTKPSKDVPCNTAAHFYIRDGKLTMTVFCRSNDIIWGCYGANAVHFSLLHQYIGAMAGYQLGTYSQISDSYHAYPRTFESCKKLPYVLLNPYDDNVAPMTLVANPATWDTDLKLFMEDPASNGYDNPFFSRVAKPMFFTHMAWRATNNPRRYSLAKDIATHIEASDWRTAALEWLKRREDKWNASGKSAVADQSDAFIPNV